MLQEEEGGMFFVEGLFDSTLVPMILVASGQQWFVPPGLG